MDEAEATVFMMTLLILAGLAVLWMAMHSRRRIREMEHRERLAMIERGLMPAPELDPLGFERRLGTPGDAAPPSRAASRFRSMGVIMVGIGLGLMMLISFAAGQPQIGLGIGGAFSLLGAAFVVNSLLSGRLDSQPTPSSAYQGPLRTERKEPPELPR